MLWLRTLVYLSPLALGFAVFLLGREVARLDLSDPGEALTTSIREPVGPIHPFAASEGIPREIRDLVFAPLLMRDAKSRLRPHLIESWSFRTLVTLHCESEESAGEVEAMIRSREYLPEDLDPSLIDRMGSVVTVLFDGFVPEVESDFVPLIDEEKLAVHELIELTVAHSVEDSIEAFLSSSIEKRQIAMLDFEGDRVARLYVGGDLEPFLEEFELFYDSNPTLEHRIERKGRRSHLITREALVTLRDDVLWHDGVPVGADDLLFSIEELTRRDPSSPLHDLFWFAESVERAGPRGVRLLCRETPSVIMECWEQLPLLPSHYFEDGLTPETWEAFLDKPIGCGPYRVENRYADGGIELLSHARHFPGVPRQRRLIYREFESLESKLLALRSGRVDAMIPDQRFAAWARRNPGQIETVRGKARFQHLVAWNLERAPFSDVRFREALALGVSTGELLEDDRAILRQPETVFRQRVRGLFLPGAPWAPESFLDPEYAPRSAARILEDLGWEMDESSGLRVDDSGAKLSFQLAVNRRNAEHAAYARNLQRQWSALGILVEIEWLDLAELVSRRLVPRDYDGALLSWEIPSGRDRWATFHSESAESGRGNVFGLRDEKVDQYLETLRYRGDREVIGDAAAGLQERIAELQPCLFLSETGRIHWLREGGIRLKPPESIEWLDAAGEDPALIGPAGLARSRPWWVKQVEVSMETGRRATP